MFSMCNCFQVFTAHLRVNTSQMSLTDMKRNYKCKEWGNFLSSPQWFLKHVKDYRCKQYRKPFSMHSCVQRNHARKKNLCASAMKHTTELDHINTYAQPVLLSVMKEVAVKKKLCKKCEKAFTYPFPLQYFERNHWRETPWMWAMWGKH